MRLSKTDFMDFQTCSKALWLKLNKPDALVWPTPSEFDQARIRDGYAVERIAREYFEAQPDSDNYAAQYEFETPEGLYARTDILRTNADGSVDLFEVKSSTDVKSSSGSDHVMDVAFQTIVAERCGYVVNTANVIHVYKSYVRRGAIDPAQLLAFVDVTEDVRSRYASIAAAMDRAHAFLSQPVIDETFCDCRFKGRGQHCAAFGHFNRDIVEPSFYALPNLRKAREFAQRGYRLLTDVPEEDLSAKQLAMWRSAVKGAPVVNLEAVEAFLAQVDYPIFFYDYETIAAAVPRADGHAPHQALPVQFSVHRLDADGTLTHFEHLSMSDGEQEALVVQLIASIAMRGTAVAWNMSFEKGCNTRLAALFPRYAARLQDLSDRTIDLMAPFKEDYVDARFGGSASIKNVLPVLCPHLKYNPDAVHDGGGAVAAWIEMVETRDDQRRAQLREELLRYCELDTYAMVEIFGFLKSNVRT